MANLGVIGVERRKVSGGRRRAEPVVRRRRPGWLWKLAGYVVGVLLAAAAWYFLVRAAIDFGRVARDNGGAAWVFCVGATVGATVCLLLLFVLVVRAWALVAVPRSGPRRSGHKH